MSATANEGLEHLQGAAREMVAAARSFLDAVDGVISDDERFAGMADGVADVLSRVGTVLAGSTSDDEEPPPTRARRIVVD